jgi:hypothetical protein
MDIKLIIELIGMFGFPITACLILGAFIFKIYKKSEEREAALRNEISEAQEINKEAIKTLALYAERLGVIENDVREIKTDIMILTERTSNN